MVVRDAAAAALSIAAFGPQIRGDGTRRGWWARHVASGVACCGERALDRSNPEDYLGRVHRLPSEEPRGGSKPVGPRRTRLGFGVRFGPRLDAWADPAARRDLPDHVLVITNVSLSPVGEKGGHDSIIRHVQDYVSKLRDSSRDVGDDAKKERLEKLRRVSKIKVWRFWDRTQVTALLDRHAEVRHAFTPFVTPLDVFAALAQFSTNLPLQNVSTAIERHARAQLTSSDGIVYFDDAGDDARGLPIDQVAIDIPVSFEGGMQHSTALELVWEMRTMSLHRGSQRRMLLATLFSLARPATARRLCRSFWYMYFERFYWQSQKN